MFNAEYIEAYHYIAVFSLVLFTLTCLKNQIAKGNDRKQQYCALCIISLIIWLGINVGVQYFFKKFVRSYSNVTVLSALGELVIGRTERLS